VQQCRGVDKFHCGGQLVMAVARIVEQARTGQCQHRPHPLASASYQVPGQFRNKRDFRLHTVQNDGIDPVHLWHNEFEHGFKRGRAMAA